MHEQVAQYVETARSAGIPDEQIRRNLLDVGWQKDVIDAGLGVAAQQPETPAPAPASVQPQPTAVADEMPVQEPLPVEAQQIHNELPQGSAPQQEMSQAMHSPFEQSHARVAELQFVPSEEAPPRSGMSMLMSVVGTLFLFVAVAYAGYMYVWPMLLTSDGAPYDPDTFFSELVVNVATLTSGRYELGFVAQTETREANVQSLEEAFPQYIPRDDVSFEEMQNEKLITTIMRSESGYISALGLDGLEFRFALNGTFGTDDTVDIPDGEFRVTLVYTSPDFSINADADIRIVDEMIYVRLNRFPALFGDFGALRGKWIAVMNVSELAGYQGVTMQDEAEVSTEERTRALESFMGLVQAIDDTKVVYVDGAPAPEAVDGEMAYRYSLKINTDKVIPFIDRVKSVMEQYLTPEEYTSFATDIDEVKRSYANDVSIAEYINFLQDQSRFIVWIGEDVKVPLRIALVTKIAPSSATLASDIQINTGFGFKLKDINEKLQITVPSEFMMLEEAEELLFGGEMVVARRRAQDAAVQAMVMGVQPAMNLCEMDGQPLTRPAANVDVCVGSGMQYPDLQGYTDGAWDWSFDSGEFDGTTGDGTYKITAKSIDGDVISCTESRCDTK